MLWLVLLVLVIIGGLVASALLLLLGSWMHRARKRYYQLPLSTSLFLAGILFLAFASCTILLVFEGGISECPWIVVLDVLTFFTATKDVSLLRRPVS